jgi:hypothetical protein
MIVCGSENIGGNSLADCWGRNTAENGTEADERRETNMRPANASYIAGIKSISMRTFAT